MKAVYRELLEMIGASTITQLLLVVMVFGPLAYLLCAGMQIPPELWGFGGAILGFFFGRKTAQEEKTVRSIH